jgi:hypothetical protein
MATGTIPSEFAMLTDLQVLDLSLSHYLGKLKSRPGLNAVKQRFVPLPSELGALTKLQHFSVAGSLHVGGTIPTEYSQMSSLQTFWVDRTDITGNIPDGMCYLPNLEVIMHSEMVNCPCLVDTCELLET